MRVFDSYAYYNQIYYNIRNIFYKVKGKMGYLR